MANLNRFTCCETNMLASDLARLLQSPSPGSAVVGSAASRVARAPAGFSGIILLYDGRPCAAVGYSQDPGGTVVISEPVVLMDAADKVCHALCDRLLKQVKHRAAADGAQRLHFLQQKASGDPKFEELLKVHGFVHATDILQWELSVATGFQCSPPDPCEFQLYDFPETSAVSVCELQNALAEILTCSEDLTSQARPTASELLTRWQGMSATVFLCRLERRIAGLISLGTHTMTSAAIAPDASLSDTCLCVEYIGVVPEFRRRQIASLMIRQIPMLISQKGDVRPEPCSSEALKVTVYSDATNTPAACLYERTGFAPTVRMQLWCCDLHQAASRLM